MISLSDAKNKLGWYKFLKLKVVQARFEPRCEKTGLRGFRPGPTLTGLCNHRRWLEA